MASSLSRLGAAENKLIMIGGKGGVGKTTCAAALALHFSRLGRKTLVISSDPTPSLSDIFETSIGDRETPVNGVQGLYGIEIMSTEGVFMPLLSAEDPSRPFLLDWEDR